MKKIWIFMVLAIVLWLGYRSELCFGRVLNESGDGKEYNGESYYNYIAYGEEYHTNDIVMTYFLLNPFNNYFDDYIYRKDFLIFKNVG